MFPELHTERFRLCRIEASDQPFIFKGLSDPRVIPYYGVQYSSLEATRSQIDFFHRIWNEKTGCWWKIVDNQQGCAVGACGINGYQAANEKAEIGYWLLPEFWKQGIMQESLSVMIRYVFANWKLHRLEAVIEDGNVPSIKLSEKLGFRYEGFMRETEIKHGKRISLHMYSLLVTDLPAID